MASSNPSISQLDGDKSSQPFWTICPLCHYAYEYTKEYENLDLLCQTCRRPFRSIPMSCAPPIVPGTDAYFHWGFGYGAYPSSVATSSDVEQNVGFPGVPLFSPSHPTMAETEDAHIGSFEQKSWHTPIQNPSDNPDSVNLFSRSKLGNSEGHGSGVLDHKVDKSVPNTDTRVTRSRSSPFENDHVDAGNEILTRAWPLHGNVARNAKNLLEKKAKFEVLRNLSEQPFTDEKSVPNNVPVIATTVVTTIPRSPNTKNYTTPMISGSKSSNSKNGNKGPTNRTSSATNQKKHGSDYVVGLAASKRQSPANRSPRIQELSKDVLNYDEVEETLDTSFSIDVPDSDFYNFDDDRTEYSFEEGQIWAVYDEEDGMPRIYARIQRVISHMPFSVKLSWLQSVTGTKRSCGKFRIGTSTMTNVLNLFSHKIVCDTSPYSGGLTFYPGKNEVWAVHDRSSTDREGSSRYKIVEILQDYTEEHSDALISLVKVSGFKSVYQRLQTDLGPFSTVRSLSLNDLHNFSHQIPGRNLEEYIPGLPENCWELDPAAIPECLLKGVSV